MVWSRRPRGDGRTLNRRELMIGLAAVALVGATACAATERSRSTPTGPSVGTTVALPAPSTDGAVSLERAIDSRRSAREFSPEPLPLATLAQLLWAGQGITDPGGKRAAPSAGALYPLELYVVTAAERIHYLPDGHRAEIRATHDLRPVLRDAAVGQESLTAAPAIIVIAAAVGRTQRTYGARAELYAHLEAGHACQNMLLTATAHDLVSVPIGAFDPAAVGAALALPEEQTVLYLIPVGRPPHGAPDD